MIQGVQAFCQLSSRLGRSAPPATGWKLILTPQARPAIHPGEILAEELQELEMSANELATILRVPANGASPPIQPCVLANGSAQDRKSGSTCKSLMNCTWPKKRPAKKSSAPFPPVRPCWKPVCTHD